MRSEARLLVWFPVSLALAFGVGAVAPGRAASDIKTGDVRTAQARAGVPMRELPRPMAKRVAVLPYGTQVKVDEVETLYAHVSAEGLGQGWVRSMDLVEPTALTGPGAYGPQGAGKVASADVTAAGRQFDQKTERTFRSMKDGSLDAAYAAVDRLEQQQQPSDEEIEAFIREGMLGGTELGGEAMKYSKLRFLGSSGDGAVEVTAPAEEAWIPQPTPESDAEFIGRLGQQFSPEQEYWLGRSVAAAAIAEHGLDPDAKRQALVRKIGATIVRLSDRLRGTYGGYHFAVLADPTPNGISGPGGFVFITRGAMDLARNEDEIAGIIGHELAHVAHKHGEAMIRKMREFQDKLDELKKEAIKPKKGVADCNICADVARLLGEASTNLAKVLNVEGYGKDFELTADWDGSLFLCEVGYRASAVAEYLEVMPTREGAHWTTHPDNAERVEALRPIVYRHSCSIECDGGALARQHRYQVVAGTAIPAAKSQPAAPARSPVSSAPAAPALPR